jgi:glycosyltransferase involved in cell wall biosynthesis
VKIAEAFAYGTPVVSTSLGCAGYPVASGRELLIHDDPAGFAAGCVSILNDPQLGDRLAAAGRALYEQLYTPDAIAKLIREVVAPLG